MQKSTQANNEFWRISLYLYYKTFQLAQWFMFSALTKVTPVRSPVLACEMVCGQQVSGVSLHQVLLFLQAEKIKHQRNTSVRDILGKVS